jgi:hypothetical protein
MNFDSGVRPSESVEVDKSLAKRFHSTSNPLGFLLSVIMAVTAPTRRRPLRNDILAARMRCQGSHRSNTASLYCRQLPEPRNPFSKGYLTYGCARASWYISRPPAYFPSCQSDFPFRVDHAIGAT